MVILPFNQLGEIFGNQARDTWQRLGFVKDSFQNRGVLGQIRFGEETITDLMLMDLYVKGSTVILFKQTSKPAESVSGTDFELWLGTDQLGWYRFAIQAKKLDLRTDRYSTLPQNNSNGLQIDLLEQFANAKGAAPLYCLYNYTDNAKVSQHWHCCNAYPNLMDLRELGCSVTPSSTIRKAISNWGTKNFRYIHRMPNTLPWRCLVSCPKVWGSLSAISGRAEPIRLSDVSPLFQPSSCYHQALPTILRRDSGRATVIRESKAGGSLMSLQPDAYYEISDAIDRIDQSDFVESTRQNRRRSGLPKAIAILSLERDTP